MAENCHLSIKANGEDIKGESSVTSLGREDTIECFIFEHMVKTSQEGGSGIATGHRIHGPVIITKRIDKSTPLLYKALRSNAVIEGSLKFYRPNPLGDGTTQQFYTIKVKGGRISSIKQILRSTFDPNTSNFPAMEEVSITYSTIHYIYEPNHAEDIDSWHQGA